MITIDTNTGMSAQDTAAIRQAIVDDWTAVFDDESATLNTGSESPAGQIIDSIAVLVTAKDSELLNLMNQFNPKTASGIFQDALGSIYFLKRKTAQPTVVTCQLTGAQGTVIPAGAIIQNEDGIKLTSVGAVTIGADGTAEVEFQTQETGPIAIGAESCTKIVTVIPGWDTVNNSAAGTLGQDVESQYAFEKRRVVSVSKNSHGSRLSLQGAVGAIENVLDCLVLENKNKYSMVIQGVYVGSHAVAICVYGGSNDDIAETIYNKLDAGCGTYGNTAVSYTSEDGVVNTYQIVRPTPVNVYINVTINQTNTTNENVVNDVKQAVYNDFYGNDINSGNTRRGMGQTIYASSFSVATIKTAGVTDLVSITISRTPSPLLNQITMLANEEPVLSLDNITVTIQGA